MRGPRYVDKVCARYKPEVCSKFGFHQGSVVLWLFHKTPAEILSEGWNVSAEQIFKITLYRCYVR